MSGFVLHPGAFKDLEEIWEFIAADNLGAADRVLEEIYEAIRACPLPTTGS
jgi:plasmid stabilization system protein ParE